MAQCCLLKDLNSQLFLHLKVRQVCREKFLFSFEVKAYCSPESAALASLSSPESHPPTHIIGGLT